MGTSFDDGGDEREGTDELAPVEAPMPETPPLVLPVGLHLDVPHASYHADCTEGISLSASIASEIATRSPRHGWRLHPKLGGKTERATRTMNSGTLLHGLMLGSGPKVRLVNADNWKKKAAQEEKKEAEAAGELPILMREFEKTSNLVAESHLILRERFGIDLVPMQHEVTGIWREPDGTLCRLRADAWDEADAHVYDVKFLTDAEPKAFTRHVMNFGCHVQDAAYRSGFGALFPTLEGRVRFTFIAIEQSTGEPLVAELDGGMCQLGRSMWDCARGRWAECLKSEKWPGYADDQRARISAPEWATRDLLRGGSVSPPF